MADQVAQNWNPLICSLTLMFEKLDALGFTFYNGVVTYNEGGGDGNA